jgi:hypothetical protein
MRARATIRIWSAGLAWALASLAHAQTPVVLDNVVAVVNQHAILLSDLDDEIRLSVLDPGQHGGSDLTRRRALELLISRSLIEQQIRSDDLQSVAPTAAQIDGRVAEMRRRLPLCLHGGCTSEDDWTRVLAARGLTPERVRAYVRRRLEVLVFIEQRFRQGIRIEPQEVESYYRENFVPQFGAEETPPPLSEVSARIEEILLERRVSALFDDWLTNLRKQGDVEVLDPALAESPQKSETQP